MFEKVAARAGCAGTQVRCAQSALIKVFFCSPAGTRRHAVCMVVRQLVVRLSSRHGRA